MTDSDRPDEGQDMGLVMPFTACTSHGGPYDDAAFVAGYATAQLDQVLQLAAGAMVTAVWATVRTALVPQLDLVAMRWGFNATGRVLEDSPEWSSVSFVTHSPRRYLD